MTKKTKKVLNIVVNSVVTLIVVLVLILAVNIIASAKKGYTSLFGNAYVSVQTDSMVGDKPDCFNPGDLLKVKILSEKDKNELKEGDIIMFYDYVGQDRHAGFNSHRIVQIMGEGEGRTYITKGDNSPATDTTTRSNATIVGKVVSHTAGLGKATDWFNSQTGFFICVVLPSLLVVAYCVFNLVKVLKERNKEVLGDKEAQMREQIMQELREEGAIPPAEEGADGNGTTEDKKSDDAK